MAMGIITGSTANAVIAARIQWESVADEAKGCSTVTARLQLRRTNQYSGQPTSGQGSFTLEIDGQVRAVSGLSLTIPNNGSWVTALEASVQVNHGADGSKTVALVAVGSLPPSSVTWVECRGVAVLDNISRCSRIVCFGSESGLLNDRLVGRLEAVVATAAHSWRLLLAGAPLAEGVLSPGEQLLELQLDMSGLVQCYYATTQGSTVTLAWEVTTFADAACTQPLGDPRVAEAELTIPQNGDTLPLVELEWQPVGLEEIYDSDSHIRRLCIENKTRLEVRPLAQGQFGASVEQVSVTWNGLRLEEKDGVYRSDLLTQVGDFLLVAEVTDSRGFSARREETVRVLNYADPQLLSANCFRCDDRGEGSEEGTGLWVAVEADHQYFAGYNGDDNPCSLYLQYKPVTQEAYGEPLLVFKSLDQDSDRVQLSGQAPVTLDTERSYHIRLILRDQLGGEMSTVFLVPTARVHCHEGAGFLALGKYAEGAGVDIAAHWPVRIRGQIYLGNGDMTLEQYIQSILKGG